MAAQQGWNAEPVTRRDAVSAAAGTGTKYQWVAKKPLTPKWFDRLMVGFVIMTVLASTVPMLWGCYPTLGPSMEPTLPYIGGYTDCEKPDNTATQLKVGDIVRLSGDSPLGYSVKRVAEIDPDRGVFVRGDNADWSADSSYGADQDDPAREVWIPFSAVLGRVTAIWSPRRALRSLSGSGRYQNWIEFVTPESFRRTENIWTLSMANETPAATVTVFDAMHRRKVTVAGTVVADGIHGFVTRVYANNLPKYVDSFFSYEAFRIVSSKVVARAEKAIAVEVEGGKAVLMAKAVDPSRADAPLCGELWESGPMPGSSWEIRFDAVRPRVMIVSSVALGTMQAETSDDGVHWIEAPYSVLPPQETTTPETTAVLARINARIWRIRARGEFMDVTISAVTFK